MFTTNFFVTILKEKQNLKTLKNPKKMFKNKQRKK